MNSSYQDVETARTIQISFDNTIAEAKLFEPTFGSTEATASFPRGNSITLSVPDHVVVLEITPSEATDTVAPPAPLNLTGSSGVTAANLTWGTSGSENAAYIVYRNDVQIATTTQMSYTDTELPVNMLFKYCVSAVDEAGNISKWAEIYLRTARHAIPGRIEAELFCASGGTGIKSTSDGGGSRILAFIGPGDWALYDVNRAVSGKYRVEMRLATAIDTENRDSTSIILISTRQLLSPNQPPEWPGRVQFRKPLA